MYSVVLATALMAGGELPSWHNHGGCHGCHGCYGGNAFSCYASSCHGCYGGGCYGCYSSCSCFGGCYSSCSCFGGCYSSCSCFGGCYSSCSCFGGYYGCSGCYSSCFSSCSGCFSSGTPIVIQAQVSGGGPKQGGGPGPKGDMEKRLQKIEKTLDKLTDMLEKGKKRPGAGPGAPGGSGEVDQESAPAQITVSLPATARLYVDGKLCPLTSNERTFTTSAVAPGQKYFHTLRVEMNSNGQPMSKSQQVVFEAGQHVQVNFNAASGEFTVVRD